MRVVKTEVCVCAECASSVECPAAAQHHKVN